MPLSEIAHAIDTFVTQQLNTENRNGLLLIALPLWRTLTSLMGNSLNPSSVFANDDTMKQFEAQESRFLRSCSMVYQTLSNLLLGEIVPVKKGDDVLLDKHHTHRSAVLTLLVQSLALLNSSDSGRIPKVNILKRNMRTLKTYAQISPQNCLGTKLFLEAEMAARFNKSNEAIEKYNASAAMHLSNGNMMEEGLALERLAKFHIKHGEFQVAVSKLEAAATVYHRWGAFAVVARIEAMKDSCLRKNTCSSLEGDKN